MKACKPAAITMLLIFLLCGSWAAPAQDEIISYTKVGQPMPVFTVTDTENRTINIADLKGKVALINFWATWCGPCVYEMPRLEKEVWQKYKSDNFVMLAIAREETLRQINDFREKETYTFPMAADPDRSIFRLFANGGIPRSYVVGVDGKILFQSDGYLPEEFDKMLKVLNAELKKAAKTKSQAD